MSCKAALRSTALDVNGDHRPLAGRMPTSSPEHFSPPLVTVCAIFNLLDVHSSTWLFSSPFRLPFT